MREGDNHLSLKQLLLLVVAAVIVSFAIMLIVIWPAEFDKDPTGLGEKMGIKGMSVAQNESGALSEIAAGTREQSARHTRYEKPIDFVEVEILLEPYGQAEYKFNMHKGQKISYQWQAIGGLVYADLHGHTPNSSGDGEVVEQYLESDTVTQESGEFSTPFTGEHGWYFLNLETTEVKVKLRASGHWDSRELVPLPSQL